MKKLSMDGAGGPPRRWTVHLIAVVRTEVEATTEKFAAELALERAGPGGGETGVTVEDWCVVAAVLAADPAAKGVDT